jgi:DNA-binding Lrp family transcriptional regulator
VEGIDDNRLQATHKAIVRPRPFTHTSLFGLRSCYIGKTIAHRREIAVTAKTGIIREHKIENARIPMKLDRIDLKILSELQKNGRITNVELADLVNLSPSPCLMRVKKLQTEGYIAGYSAQIDLSKLGQTLTVFTEITLKNHRQIDFARFLATVDKIDEVIECHLVSGGYDYLMKFVTSGIAEYQTIMERLIDLDVGIDKYFSYVVLKSPIVKTHLPLDKIFEA